MITGSKEELDKIVESYLCPEHGKKLVVAWFAIPKGFESEHSGLGRTPTAVESRDGGCYVIRCGEGEYPEEVTRELTRTQEFKAGQLEKINPLFNLLPITDLATGDLLTHEAVQFLVAYAERYGLDAYRGHVMYMYGKPYIGLDGYLYHANKEKIPYQLRSRPLNEDERKTYQVGENDHAWTCEVVLPLTNHSFTGLGIVTRQEMAKLSKKDKTKLRSPVVAAHPWQLAQKRAEWQAMRRGFPIGETEEGKEE